MSGKSRKESTPTQQKSNSGSRTSTPVKEARGTPALAARSHVVIASQRHGDNSATAQRYQEDSDGFQHQMPPPRLLQATQQHHETSTHEAEHHPEPPQPSRARAHSLPRHAPESNSAPTAPRTPTCSPNDHPPPPRDCTRKTRDRTVDNPSAHLHAPGSELLRKRQEYTASLSKANSSSISAALGQLAQQDEKQQFEADREHGLEQGFERAGPELRRSGAGAAVFLGNSVLGGKKMGGVPVAPMAHVRRDGGLGGVRGRREY
ncbi:uncharacterized protein M421DRAFT_198218 [Didymella exigua CBS 183.55]|uniref:Uncharacterized protein n=1 Tax=Didymella exigua CBS 183.55 TaxID=1150837 RepID=A0A6A5S2E7_9PLEO|nr:uncharacterized protein M421DRAFT_198218 [Didymella exigua CBS 183.55]KAF1933488.1 hypothetical protein M421DRAFT_198218 [Didymella exigua CBS 183.55]